MRRSAVVRYALRTLNGLIDLPHRAWGDFCCSSRNYRLHFRAVIGGVIRLLRTKRKPRSMSARLMAIRSTTAQRPGGGLLPMGTPAAGPFLHVVPFHNADSNASLSLLSSGTRRCQVCSGVEP
jgi:hypothetical protein